MTIEKHQCNVCRQIVDMEVLKDRNGGLHLRPLRHVDPLTRKKCPGRNNIMVYPER